MTFFKRYKILIGIIISAVLLIAIFYSIDISILFQILKSFNYHILFILLLLYIIDIFIRSLRWKLITGIKSSTSWRAFFSALSIGFMTNNLFPAKIGEIIRSEIIVKKTNQGRSFIYGTVFIERLLDSLILLFFLSISIVFSETLLLLIKDQFYIIISGFIFVIFVIIIFYKSTRITNILFSIFPEKIKVRVLLIIDKALSSLKFLKSSHTSLKVFTLTILLWALTLFNFYLIMWSLNINLPFYAYFFIISFGALGMIIPSSPGNVGVYHAVSMSSLMLFGVEKEVALSYAIISHALDIFPSYILGLITLTHSNISLFNLIKINKDK